MKNYLAYFVVELDGDADSMKEAGFIRLTPLAKWLKF